VGGFVGGLLVGGLVGAGAMLFLAPQSGRETRAEIRQEGLELQRQVTDPVQDAMAQARVRTRQVTATVHKHAEQLEERAQGMFEGQRRRLSTAIEAGKTAVHPLAADGDQPRA
jgi:gas vesicle protein